MAGYLFDAPYVDADHRKNKIASRTYDKSLVADSFVRDRSGINDISLAVP